MNNDNQTNERYRMNGLERKLVHCVGEFMETRHYLTGSGGFSCWLRFPLMAVILAAVSCVSLPPPIAKTKAMTGKNFRTQVTTGKTRKYDVKSFRFDQIWGGESYLASHPVHGHVRVKVSLNCEQNVFAELYFFDSKEYKPIGIHKNPEPLAEVPREGVYYVLCFPLETAALIQQQLYHAGGGVRLLYYYGNWCVVTDHETLTP